MIAGEKYFKEILVSASKFAEEYVESILFDIPMPEEDFKSFRTKKEYLIQKAIFELGIKREQFYSDLMKYVKTKKSEAK